MAELPCKPRTLVLCFDGTANEYDADNTNVVKLFALLKKDDFNEQLCYYQPGIGTFFSPGVVTPIFQWCAKILDEAVAWYLDAHVMDGYKFVMQNYRVGDKICLFGFSRGAYTARALAGCLHKVGLLPRDNDTQIPFAYKLYKRTDAASVDLCSGFKQTYCQDVKVEFMGVWDTVASVGVIMGHTLPFTNSNRSIKTFRHALSLDEHRAKFRPNQYHRTSPNDAAAKYDPEHASPVVEGVPGSDSSTSSNGKGQKKKNGGFLQGFNIRPTKKSYLRDLVEEGEPDDVLEVWFSGCHSDVGGGAVSNATTSCLASITLRWMVREVFASGCGIQFDPDALARVNIDPSAVITPAEQTLDQGDAGQPLHDELKLDVLWWVLEIIPLHYSWQDADGCWHKDWNANFGRGRNIQDAKPNFHVTVKERMAAAGLKYAPKAKWTKGSEVYVQ